MYFPSLSKICIIMQKKTKMRILDNNNSIFCFFFFTEHNHRWFVPANERKCFWLDKPMLWPNKWINGKSLYKVIVLNLQRMCFSYALKKNVYDKPKLLLDMLHVFDYTVTLNRHYYKKKNDSNHSPVKLHDSLMESPPLVDDRN